MRVCTIPERTSYVPLEEEEEKNFSPLIDEMNVGKNWDPA